MNDLSDILHQNADLMESYFVKSVPQKLDVNQLEFNGDKDGTFKRHFEQFFDSQNEETILDFCLFVTGRKEIPRTTKIKIVVEECDALFSSTCEETLTIPKKLFKYETFEMYIMTAMEHNGNFFNTV